MGPKNSEFGDGRNCYELLHPPPTTPPTGGHSWNIGSIRRVPTNSEFQYHKVPSAVTSYLARMWWRNARQYKSISSVVIRSIHVSGMWHLEQNRLLHRLHTKPHIPLCTKTKFVCQHICIRCDSSNTASHITEKNQMKYLVKHAFLASSLM